MSYKQKELQQLIESKLVENILDEDFTDSDEEEISEIFILSLLALNEARYLEPRIYNVAKSQYCNPYRNQAEFNRIFSSHRIIIEHAFGRLKNRFAGIREISVKKIPTAINMIDCSIILHNFLELRDDVWENQCESNEEEDNNELDNSNEENLKILGEAKRNWIMRKLFHPYNLY
ncbi:unnamed protein product [Rhizophagus irregularis]|uniref:DDE Tnp4 domain-containing protein n=1 Tax=Rhizophagus irregularis TaxID=588596 RepID=A0A915ZHX7_9GLOM|nr:unnamed protein product [Rhizophagus irregularis]